MINSDDEELKRNGDDDLMRKENLDDEQTNDNHQYFCLDTL